MLVFFFNLENWEMFSLGTFAKVCAKHIFPPSHTDHNNECERAKLTAAQYSERSRVTWERINVSRAGKWTLYSKKETESNRWQEGCRYWSMGSEVACKNGLRKLVKLRKTHREKAFPSHWVPLKFKRWSEWLFLTSHVSVKPLDCRLKKKRVKSRVQVLQYFLLVEWGETEGPPWELQPMSNIKVQL